MEKPRVQYRLYKRRFAGLLGFVRLSRVSGRFLPYVRSCLGSSRACHGLGLVRFRLKVDAPFSSVSIRSHCPAATDFGISVNQVNWLCNIVCCIFIPVSLLVPAFCSRFGVTRCVCPSSLVYPFLIPTRPKPVLS